MLKKNTDFLCSCSNYSSLHVCVKTILFGSNYVSGHKYINEKNHNIFASFGQ